MTKDTFIKMVKISRVMQPILGVLILGIMAAFGTLLISNGAMAFEGEAFCHVENGYSFSELLKSIFVEAPMLQINRMLCTNSGIFDIGSNILNAIIPVYLIITIFKLFGGSDDKKSGGDSFGNDSFGNRSQGGEGVGEMLKTGLGESVRSRKGQIAEITFLIAFWLFGLFDITIFIIKLLARGIGGEIGDSIEINQ